MATVDGYLEGPPIQPAISCEIQMISQWHRDSPAFKRRVGSREVRWSLDLAPVGKDARGERNTRTQFSDIVHVSFSDGLTSRFAGVRWFTRANA